MGTTSTSRSIYTVRRTLTLILCILLTCSIRCDARGKTRASRGPRHPRSRLFKRMAATSEGELMESSNTGPYWIGSPFTLPPFESLPPVTLPDTSPSPPFCENPPSTPETPPGILPSPAGNPPFYYVPPVFPVPGPPGSMAPSPPMISSSPPQPYFEPSPNPPPYYFPSPPSGGGGGLSPPTFLPPVIFPAPRTPPPPKRGPSMALWCVAKPSVPDPIIQEATNYACGSGADCTPIQPNGLCFEPNTLFAHASYAFNSYWQRTKVAGGSCSFGGIAMLVTVDPSYDGCHFVYS